MKAVFRHVQFRDGREKAAYLDAAASLDARHPVVRKFAGRFALAHDSNDFEGMVRDVFHFVRDAIHYVHDPTYEEFADTATIITRGFDDCDGKARTFVSLCRAIGIEARIRPVFNAGGQFVHVQAEARWRGSEHVKGAQPGGWVLAETTIRGCELGQDPATAPRGPDGHLLLT
jgi:transglutaminase-like putative cysteine protease